MADSPIQTAKKDATYRADFVRKWQAAGTIKEAAAALGCKEVEASAVAAWMRKNGVGLKKMPRVRSASGESIDFSSLAALVDAPAAEPAKPAAEPAAEPAKPAAEPAKGKSKGK